MCKNDGIGLWWHSSRSPRGCGIPGVGWGCRGRSCFSGDLLADQEHWSLLGSCRQVGGAGVSLCSIWFPSGNHLPGNLFRLLALVGIGVTKGDLGIEKVFQEDWRLEFGLRMSQADLSSEMAGEGQVEVFWWWPRGRKTLCFWEILEKQSTRTHGWARHRIVSPVSSRENDFVSWKPLNGNLIPVTSWPQFSLTSVPARTPQLCTPCSLCASRAFQHPLPEPGIEKTFVISSIHRSWKASALCHPKLCSALSDDHCTSNLYTSVSIQCIYLFSSFCVPLTNRKLFHGLFPVWKLMKMSGFSTSECLGMFEE